jgi:hypothetical protein
MSCSRKEELCNHCKNRRQEYTFFDGGAIYLTVDKCILGHNIHSLEPECEDFKCSLKYKIKSIFVKRGDL